MKNKTSKIKAVKPVDSMVDFRYICPNPRCSFDNWLTKKECQTKNFKVVCDCGEIFKPKQIQDIEIIYIEKYPVDRKEKHKNIPTPETNNKQKTEDDKEKNKFIEEAVKTLLAFGFTKEESNKMIIEEYEKTKIENPATLVKNSLDFFGGKNG